MTARTLLFATMSEADLLAATLERLALGGWRAMHVRQQGSRTWRGGRPLGVLQAVPPAWAWGWPDVIALHALESRPLVLELKRQDGKVTPEQRQWLQAWHLAGAEAATPRPADLDALTARLVHHRRCPEPCTGGALCISWCRALNEARACAEHADARLSPRRVSRA